MKRLPKKIQNSSGVEKFEIELDEFRINYKKKKLRGNFLELSDEIFYRI